MFLEQMWYNGGVQDHAIMSRPYRRFPTRDPEHITRLGGGGTVLRCEMKTYRRAVPKSMREKIFDECNGLCAYCNYEPATEIEHIIPYAFLPLNDETNLVSSCTRCNRLAGDLVFDDFDKKREFILKRREEKKVQNAFLKDYSFCIDCQHSYNPRVKGSTMFLCSKCAKVDMSQWVD